MINFIWNTYKFSLIQFGRGVFQKDMTGHSHSANSYELHYITGGKGSLATDSTTYVLTKGDFFITGPEIYHKQTTDKDEPLEEIYIYLQTNGKRAADALVSAFLDTHFYIGKHEELEKCFELIMKEQTENKLGYTAAIGAVMQYILTKITRIYLPDFGNLPEMSENLNDRRFVIIESAFIYNAENITLSELAEEVGLCERQLQRLLNKYYGKTFLQKKEEALKGLGGK